MLRLIDHRGDADLCLDRHRRAGYPSRWRASSGLSLGGEYGASATYLSEVADPGIAASIPASNTSPDRRQLTAIIVLLLLQKGILDAGRAEGLGLADPIRDRRPACGFRSRDAAQLHETEAFVEAARSRNRPARFAALLRLSA